MTFLQKRLSLNKIIILTPSRQKNLIFSKRQCRMSIFFLSTVLPIKLDQNIKKLEHLLQEGIKIDIAQCVSLRYLSEKQLQ